MSIQNDPPGFRSCNRLYEWTAGAALFGYGLHVMFNPQTLSHSRYAAIILIFNPWVYGFLCFLMGSIRLVSLYKNGTWPIWGPRIRILVSLASLGLFAQIFVALGQWTYAAPSPGIWVYAAFMGAELRTIWRTKQEVNARGI